MSSCNIFQSKVLLKRVIPDVAALQNKRGFYTYTSSKTQVYSAKREELIREYRILHENDRLVMKHHHLKRYRILEKAAKKKE